MHFPAPTLQSVLPFLHSRMLVHPRCLQELYTGDVRFCLNQLDFFGVTHHVTDLYTVSTFKCGHKLPWLNYKKELFDDAPVHVLMGGQFWEYIDWYHHFGRIEVGRRRTT